jgi:hypothetical protein
MADMNKKPGTRRSALEDELIGDITDQASTVERGKEIVHDKYTLGTERRYRKLNIAQGHRRRHPDRVLQQHEGIKTSTEHAESVWEQAMLHDEERTKIPEEYKHEGSSMMSNQVGLSAVSTKNYKAKKNRMDHFSTVVGV